MDVTAVSAEKWYFRGKKGANRFFAVQSTDLTLRQGTVTVLMGKSGSGKTTLLHMLSGVLRPSGGKILMGGQEIYAMDDETLSRFRNLHTAIIPQGAELLQHLTVMENILLPLGIYGKETSPETIARAEELCERLGIASLKDVMACELSGGERRRVCVARALAGKRQVVFADEPTSDLDEENTKTVLQLLKEAAKEGAVVFIVTHDSEALEAADVRLKMEEGKCFE